MFLSNFVLCSVYALFCSIAPPRVALHGPRRVFTASCEWKSSASCRSARNLASPHVLRPQLGAQSSSTAPRLAPHPTPTHPHPPYGPVTPLPPALPGARRRARCRCGGGPGFEEREGRAVCWQAHALARPRIRRPELPGHHSQGHQGPGVDVEEAERGANPDSLAKRQAGWSSGHSVGRPVTRLLGQVVQASARASGSPSSVEPAVRLAVRPSVCSSGCLEF